MRLCLFVLSILLLADKEGEFVEVLQCDTGTASDSTQGVFGDVDLQFGLAAHALVETAEQCTAASQIDAVLVDVGSQLGRCGGEGVEDGLLDAGDRFVEGMGNLFVVDRDFLGKAAR